MLRKALLVIISTLAVLLVGFGGMRLLMGMRTQPQPLVRTNPGKLVRVMTVQLQEVPLTVEGYGTVRSKTKWRAIPLVSGTLVQLSPNLRAGLHIKKGELLFEVDSRSYRLEIQRIRAQITQHQKQIDVFMQQSQNHQGTLRFARRNQEISSEELHRAEALLSKGMISDHEVNQKRQSHNEVEERVQTALNNLALIDPQIKEIEAAIVAARAQLADAKLQLSKTRLLAPFDGQVLNSKLEVGEFVQAGDEVATLYDTAAVEIPIALSLDTLRWLPGLFPDSFRYDAPNLSEHRPEGESDPLLDVLKGNGLKQRTHLDHGAGHLQQPLAMQAQSPLRLPPDGHSDGLRNVVQHPLQSPSATVRWRSGDREYAWQGRVVRSEAGLDEETRTMKLVVQVQEPWKVSHRGQPPLQPGMFCQVEIDAGRVLNAAVIPRTALHEHDTVFLVQEGTLRVRSVEVLRELRDQAIITAGLQQGDKLIVYRLTAPVEGMKLRPLEIEAPTPLPTSASIRLDRGAAVRNGSGQVKEER